ncbi:MAG: PAS domain-containing protein [Nitrosomonadales bacterium]|nr:PAS domain-containing protein [Nitrosomonadales bacterium]
MTTAILIICGALLLFDLALWRSQRTAGQSSRRYREIFQKSAEGILVVRVERSGHCVIAEANSAALAVLTPGCMGQKIDTLVSTMPPDRSEFLAGLQQALQRVVAEVSAGEYETAFWLAAENRTASYRVHLDPMLDGEFVEHVLVFMRDISTRKQTEALLAVRTQDFHALVEKSPDTIARYDRECNRIYANPAFKHLAVTWTLSGSKRASREYCGAGYLEKVQAVLDSGLDDETECSWKNAAGESLVSHIRLIAEHDSAGEISGVLSIGRDISALKDTERHLRESRTLLRELTARREIEDALARKEMASRMHEEYGQGLGALRMKLAMQQMRFGRDVPELGSMTGEALKLLDGTIAHMREMVSSIHPPVLNMGVASALEWLADDSLSATPIQYEVRVDEGPVKMDETSLCLVFKIVRIALSNVLNHADARNVLVALEAYGTGYRLEVRDDGRGFDLDRSRRGSLGMVAMEELSNMLGGEIVFLSEPGKGTVIEVCFSRAVVPRPIQCEGV